MLQSEVRSPMGNRPTATLPGLHRSDFAWMDGLVYDGMDRTSDSAEFRGARRA